VKAKKISVSGELLAWSVKYEYSKFEILNLTPETQTIKRTDVRNQTLV